MKQVFLAPRANETSHSVNKNVSSLLNGFPLSFYEDHFTSQERELLSQHKALRVWGAKDSLKSRWEKMNPGDYVLFYRKGEFYLSSIALHTKYSPALAQKIWGVDEESGQLWSCLYFVDHLKEISIPINIVQELAEYEPTWDRVQGFMPLRPSGVKAIENKFGSLDSFFNQEPHVLEVVSNIIEEEKDEELNLEVVDEEIDKGGLLNEINAFRGPILSHKTIISARKERVENRKQKEKIAKIEDYKCQLCGWSLQWKNSKGKLVNRIDVDHIKEKKDEGGEEGSNLWALCPNCHTKKTFKVIVVDMQKKKIYENGKQIELLSDNHLGW